MTKEEAWLAWIKAAKTTDTPIETDFELIKKTSWWQAFEAGWDLASVNLNGWDQAYAMGLEAGKEVAEPAVREVWCDCGDGIMPNSGAKCGNCIAAESASREWDGPTDEEYENFCSLIQREEAKIKEKN
jgi:sugar/nucleoside kinase (ribokinase family)